MNKKIVCFVDSIARAPIGLSFSGSGRWDGEAGQSGPVRLWLRSSAGKLFLMDWTK